MRSRNARIFSLEKGWTQLLEQQTLLDTELMDSWVRRSSALAQVWGGVGFLRTLVYGLVPDDDGRFRLACCRLNLSRTSWSRRLVPFKNTRSRGHARREYLQSSGTSSPPRDLEICTVTSESPRGPLLPMTRSKLTLWQILSATGNPCSFCSVTTFVL